MKILKVIKMKTKKQNNEINNNNDIAIDEIEVERISKSMLRRK